MVSYGITGSIVAAAASPMLIETLAPVMASKTGIDMTVEATWQAGNSLLFNGNFSQMDLADIGFAGLYGKSGYVAMAITAADPVGMGIDGGIAATMRSQSNGKANLAGLLTTKKHRDDAPPAYLNYLFFDREMNYKYGGFVQMSNKAREDGSNVAHEKLSQQVVAEEPGYFYIYLSNDSNTGSEAFSREKTRDRL